MAIQIRRGTESEWEAGKQNIVVGEPCVTTDTGRFFVGTEDGFSEMARKEDIGTFEESIETLQGEVDEINEALETKADKSDTYSKEDVDGLLDGKASTEALEELSDEVDSKADSSAVYTKSETDTLLSGKASASDLEELEEEMTDYRQMYLDSLIHTTASGSIASFSDGADGLPMDFCTATIEPKQEGSGDPSPTNIRPISGWTGAEVVRSGANVFGGQTMLDTFYAVATNAQKDETAHTVSFEGGRGEKHFFSAFKPNTRYTFILTLQHTASSTATNLRCYYTDGTGSYIDKVANTNKQTVVFTSTNGKSVAYLGSVNAGGTTTLYCEESGIFEGVLTASDFEPYDGTTYSVTWEDEAGTVYGGSVDLVSGLLTVEWTAVDMGTLNWTIYNNKFVVQLPSSKKYSVNEEVSAKCSIYVTVASTGSAGRDIDKSLWISYSATPELYVQDSSYTSASAFKTAMSGVQLVYELAQPTTYQLSGQEIKTLLGNNNVWADTGDTSVGYIADTKLYIDSKLS